MTGEPFEKRGRSSDLFLGSLSYSSTDQTVAEALSVFGRVLEARVITDRETGRSKGFGFAQFADPAAAQRAISSDLELDGRRISISMARQRPGFQPTRNAPDALASDPQSGEIPPKLNLNAMYTAEGFRIFPSLQAEDMAVGVGAAETLSWIHYAQYVGEPSLKAAIKEFETMLNQPDTPERAWQDFFTRQPQFITGYDYKNAHPHLVLRQDNQTKLIPDFVLEPYDSGELSDILELKLPRARPVVGTGGRRRQISSALSGASAQLREYHDFFESSTNRRRFQEEYGLNLFRPELILVMGRNVDFNPIEIKTLLPHLGLRTYDQILSRAKRALHR